MHIYIAMDYHELGSLDQYVGPTHTLTPESEAKNIVEQVLNALEYMHGLRFMHRDLKPAVCGTPVRLQDLNQLMCPRTERSSSHYWTSMVGKTCGFRFQQTSNQPSRRGTHRRRYASIHGSRDARNFPERYLHEERESDLH